MADADNAAVVLCDRGTVDCAAYWTGAGDLFSAVGTTHAAELARYDAVIHLRTPTSPQAYNHDNPLRLESIEEAAVIDEESPPSGLAHPRVFIVEPTEDFLHKAARASGAAEAGTAGVLPAPCPQVLLGRRGERRVRTLTVRGAFPSLASGEFQQLPADAECSEVRPGAHRYARVVGDLQRLLSSHRK